MSEDNLYLLCCYLILGITILFSTYRKKHVIQILSIHLVIALFYSGLFLYNLTFNGNGGASLVWLVYLMFAIGLHCLINFFLIVYNSFKQ
jgi:hypothetical protein